MRRQVTNIFMVLAWCVALNHCLLGACFASQQPSTKTSHCHSSSSKDSSDRARPGSHHGCEDHGCCQPVSLSSSIVPVFDALLSPGNAQFALSIGELHFLIGHPARNIPSENLYSRPPPTSIAALLLRSLALAANAPPFCRFYSGHFSKFASSASSRIA